MIFPRFEQSTDLTELKVGYDDSVDILIKLIESNKTQEVLESLKSASDGGTQICNTIGKKG